MCIKTKGAVPKTAHKKQVAKLSVVLFSGRSFVRLSGCLRGLASVGLVLALVFLAHRPKIRAFLTSANPPYIRRLAWLCSKLQRWLQRQEVGSSAGCVCSSASGRVRMPSRASGPRQRSSAAVCGALEEVAECIAPISHATENLSEP